jgi:hypothetical protein
LADDARIAAIERKLISTTASDPISVATTFIAVTGKQTLYCDHPSTGRRLNLSHATV